ncbi:MAG: helix-turn-helix domain-containing protein [Chloroflexota bacterium]|nr:helix-turn-helix domain-containing protein [Chloroflexota bacterium]
MKKARGGSKNMTARKTVPTDPTVAQLVQMLADMQRQLAEARAAQPVALTDAQVDRLASEVAARLGVKKLTYTWDEAAEALNISRNSVMLLVQRGELARVHMGGLGVARLNPDSVAEWVERNTEPINAQAPARRPGGRR